VACTSTGTEPLAVIALDAGARGVTVAGARTSELAAQPTASLPGRHSVPCAGGARVQAAHGSLAASRLLRRVDRAPSHAHVRVASRARQLAASSVPVHRPHSISDVKSSEYQFTSCMEP
jgi:hypothetical protein